MMEKISQIILAFDAANFSHQDEYCRLHFSKTFLEKRISADWLMN